MHTEQPVQATESDMASVDEMTAAPRQRDENDRLDELPQSSIRRSATIHDMAAGLGHRHRHSKKLSLNFPIAIQLPSDALHTGHSANSSWTPSPTTAGSLRNGTPVSARPLPSPEAPIDDTIESPDFLRLIAGQERRVMELKEELQKAESGLISLKKQWATFEAKKKHAERNRVLKMGPVSPEAAKTRAPEEEVDRIRRKEARERRLRELANRENESPASANGKRTGGRVFGGRHTRTLSLLQNNNATLTELQQASQTKPRAESTPSTLEQADENREFAQILDEDALRIHRSSQSRQHTLQELIASGATGAAQINLGKTYKDLANAGRKSLPPGADVFVKQGKQVYDGVSAGFWNFVEDIRQATVGDEAINGVQERPQVRKQRSNKKLAETECEKHGKHGNRNNRTKDTHKADKDIFWKEFGLDTPQGKPQPKRKPQSQSVKDHESKSSTDSSQRPPSLLADLMDVNEDEEWDTWLAESPVVQRSNERVAIRNPSDDGEDDSDGRRHTRREFLDKRNHLSQETTWAELTT